MALTIPHFQHAGNPVTLLTKPLTMRNISKLPLSFCLRTASPFSIDKGDLTLAPFEYATVNVTYDPNPAKDLVSMQAKQKLQVRVRVCVCVIGGLLCYATVNVMYNPNSIDKGDITLAPFEYATVNVTYDLNPAKDLVSMQAKQKLQVCARVFGCCFVMSL